VIIDLLYFASSVATKVCRVKGDRRAQQRFCDG